MSPLDYLHVDVFSPVPYGGNSLPVFLQSQLSPAQMLSVTQELRHFEAIFLEPGGEERSRKARIFDLFEELPFAGHPVLGAAAALHFSAHHDGKETWQFHLQDKDVQVEVDKVGPTTYSAMMDQGAAVFGQRADDRQAVADAFCIEPDGLHSNLPIEVVSTGLRYLVVPLATDVIGKAHHRYDITSLVQQYGAQFAVLLDADALEIRHWNNDGVIEDIATGSAAGSVAAYLLRHGISRAGNHTVLTQGRFAGRASQLTVSAEGEHDAVHKVRVGGFVSIVGRGTLEILP